METIHALKHLSIEDLVLPILVQLMVIVVVARLFAIGFRRIGQPAVVGEICAGLILGPSLFGLLFPDLFAVIFQPKLPEVPDALSAVFVPKIFSVLSQLGLIFLLFLIGLEFDFGHLRTHGRAAMLIAIIGIVLPFGLGMGLAQIIHPYVEPHPEKGTANPMIFGLFIGVAMSITALPILGRMMIELNITRTRLGTITITAAAVGDAAGWIMLATIAAVVKSGFQLEPMLWMIAQTVGFGLFMLFIARPLLICWLRWVLRRNQGQIDVVNLAFFLAILFGCAIITNVIGIFAIFGPFILGAVLSDQHEFRTAINARLRDIVTAFFLPIFFTNTGLRTQIGTLDSASMWLICGGVIAVAIFGKMVGSGVAARCSGFSSREASIIGVMMNTRALMELIVINVGYELGVIPRSVFCMLVLMAVLTTIMTTPILLRLVPGTELEPYIRESEFHRSNG